MTLRYVFVDEAGNLDFSPRGTRYFTLTSVVLDSCDVGQELAQLRRDLVRQGTDLREGFHATEDRQAVRDEVFKLLAGTMFALTQQFSTSRRRCLISGTTSPISIREPGFIT